ncbi:3-hydroxybutyrate dehydrogenase [Pelagibius marinus]|uniref:3-hydroxybutyrate dehydrogenase n=1 Tax=Pelagibius marinus TaxID=2762760 RepID=UPI0018732CBB|nr:3-hydroxybutyrate dehydrogenase [Pelagibius marinus]
MLNTTASAVPHSLSVLAGKTAIVTGSTSGIGLGIAQALAAEGANVVINGFGAAREIEALRSEISRDYGVEVLYSGTDMSQPEKIAEMIETAAGEFGQVDILVNNAGIQHVSPIESFPPEKWDAVLAIDLSSSFHAIRAVFAGMKERRWGRIVNVASAHGLIASPFKAAYVAAKHGLVGLTKVVALEGAECGVTCNAICPGYVWTPLVEKQIEDQAKSHGISRDQVVRDVLLAQQPDKRFATVDDIGALVAFLCGPAAQSITGAALPVDGGWTAH